MCVYVYVYVVSSSRRISRKRRAPKVLHARDILQLKYKYGEHDTLQRLRDIGMSNIQLKFVRSRISVWRSKAISDLTRSVCALYTVHRALFLVSPCLLLVPLSWSAYIYYSLLCACVDAIHSLTHTPHVISYTFLSFYVLLCVDITAVESIQWFL